MRRLCLLAAMSALFSAFAETVTIRTPADWANFAERVNAGEVALNAELVADITIGDKVNVNGNGDLFDFQCGYDANRAYRGDFNGNGHSIRYGIKFSDPRQDGLVATLSLFGFVEDGCYIHDLNVNGLIIAVCDDYRIRDISVGGIVGRVVGTGRVIMSRCVFGSSRYGRFDCWCPGASSHTDYSPGLIFMCVGGLAGGVFSGNLEIHNCLFGGFDGSVNCSDVTCFGGFVGYRAGVCEVRNSLFNSRGILSRNKYGRSGTFVGSGFRSSSDMSDCYYISHDSQVALQGIAGDHMSVEELRDALGSASWKIGDKGVEPILRFTTGDIEDVGTTGCRAFTYNGVLLDAMGKKLTFGEPDDRKRKIEFRIYDRASGGLPHWGRKIPVFLDDDGMFSVEISDVAGEELEDAPGEGLSLTFSENTAGELYIGLTVEGDAAEIMPRQRFFAVPHSIWAADCTAAQNIEVAQSLTVNDTSRIYTLEAGTLTTGNAFTCDTAVIANTLDVAGDVNIAGSLEGGGAIPLGGILVWSGTIDTIPGGWALCNGQTAEGRTTPDLRDRFIVGAGLNYGVGATGGEAVHTLSIAEMPSHNHPYSFKGADLSAGWKKQNNFYSQANRYQDLDNNAWTSGAGGNQAHENRPPYYALCYIMRVK